MSDSTPPRVALIVPSYRRPAHLSRCLDAIGRLERPADEVVVVRRRSDDDTAAIIEAFSALAVREVLVDEAGVLAAMAAGATATDAEIIGYLDDDAQPSPEWLGRVLAHFADPAVGAVGGRDVIDDPVQHGPLTRDVGRVTRWGRLIGNHHLGKGPARDVDVLKGANMAWRREALALPRTLPGAGAQAHYEVATCLWATRRGWRLVYDPAITARHAAAPRHDADRRLRPDPSAIANAAEGLTLSLISFRPALLWRRAAYGLMIGDGRTPGLVRAAVALVRGERELLRRVRPSLAGQARALAALRSGYRVPMITAAERPLSSAASPSEGRTGTPRLR